MCRAVLAAVRGADAVRVLAPRIYVGGGTSPQTGTGGSTNSGPHTVMLNQLSAFLALFLIFFYDMHRTDSPRPSVRTGAPPSQVRGARAAAQPALQIPN